MIKLSEESLKVLKQCLLKHNPALIPVIEGSGEASFTADFYNQLRQIVGDELIANGLNDDYEPNEYGQVLEGVIDEIGRLFMK